MPVSSPLTFLGEGDTALVKSRSLGPELGLSNLFFKVEAQNPSGSFKDRPASLLAALAREAGASGIVTASSGNAASAVSTYCAASGLQCLILLEAGNPAAKMRQVLATGARLLAVKGIFAEGPEELRKGLEEVARRLGYYLGFIWAPVNPYILEGIKSISYEVTDVLGGPPDAVVCPVGGGDMLTAQWYGYEELLQGGSIDRLPRMMAVQSESAPPLLEAFRQNLAAVKTLPYADSKISGINVPFTGDHALRAVRQSEGTVVGIEDAEAFAMQRRMGSGEGLWVEPASAAPVAALKHLLESGKIDPQERIVCILSGAGFKDTLLAAKEVEEIGGKEPVPFDVETIVRKVQKESPR